jgi:hypothetical protein
MNFNPVNRKAIALLVLVFALGIGLGAVGTVVVNQRVYGGARMQGGPPPRDPAAGRAQAMARMTRELDLTADQQKQISGILQNTLTQYAAIQQRMSPQFEYIRNQGNNQIRQLLTPDQAVKYDEIRKEIDEERRRRGNGNR